MRKKVICFSGIDGSGKSTHARLVFKELKAKGINCRYRWLRYPRFFSFIPEALYSLISSTRKTGFSSSSQKTHKTPFHSSRVIINLWPLFQLVDVFLTTVKNVYLPSLVHYTLILDRCVIDTLVDIAVSLKNEKLVFGVVGRSFLKLIPNDSLVLIFDVRERIAHVRVLRKNQTEDVGALTRKRILYKSLSKTYRWNVINTDEPFREVHNKVMKLLQ